MQLTSPNWLRKSTSRRTQFKMDIPIRSAHRGQFCTLRHRHNPFSLPTGCQYVLFCGSEQRTKDHVETGQRNAGLRNKPAGWVKKQWHWFGDRAQGACQFLKLHLPKVLRPWGVLLLLTSKCASRAGGVPIFASPPHPPLYRGYLSDHRGAQNIVKHSISRIFYPSSLWLMVAAQLSILSEIWLLNFLWRSAFPTTVTHLSNSSIHFRRQLHTWATPIFIFDDSYTLGFHLRRQSHTWASPGYIFDDSYTLEQLQFSFFDDSYTLQQLQLSFSTTVTHLSNSRLHFRRQLHTWATPIFIFDDSYKLDHQNRALARSLHKFLHLFQSLDITATIRIAIFMMLLHKVLRLPRKMHVETYETLRLSRKMISR